MNSRDFQAELAQRAMLAGVRVQPPLTEQLETYFRLLSAWNQKMNLAGVDISGPTPRALDRLLIEPLVAAQYVRSSDERMIDIGSGGGSPAIPLALAVPNLYVTMVESKMRKSVFLKEAVRSLGIARADVMSSRFETLVDQPDMKGAHDFATVRAVKLDTPGILALSALLRQQGRLFLFRSNAGDLSQGPIPPFRSVGIYQLVAELRSQLTILEHDVVPRGTTT